MKALVTGASGFIGSTLIEQLAARGIEVDALMRKTSDDSNLKGLKYRRVEGDLSDADSLKRAVEGVDYVFHLAGAVTAKDRAGYFRHNAEGTRRLAEAAAETGGSLKRFVHVSSLAAAGPASSRDPRREGDPNAPVSAYGESKLQGEVEVLRHKDRLPVVIVRPPMVFGPKDKGVFVVMQTVARNLMPLMQGSAEGGHKYYSSVHVDDLCQGIVQAGLAPLEKVPSGEIFYISSDEIHSYEELLKAMSESLGKRPIRVRVPMLALTAAAHALGGVSKLTGKSFALNPDKLNEILPDYWICSNAKAREVLGFRPRHDLSSGIAQTVEWYKRNQWL